VSNELNAAIIYTGRYYRISAQEFADHCKARVEHHTQREVNYRVKADQLDAEAKAQMADLEGDEALEAKLSNSYGKRSSERENAREQSRYHAKMILRFKWQADHVTPGVSMQLTLADAIHLELVA